MQQKESKSKFHFFMSMGKSVIRIVAGVALYQGNVLAAGILIIVAELLGIVEEL